MVLNFFFDYLDKWLYLLLLDNWLWFLIFFYEIKEILCINEFIDKYVLFKVYKVRDLCWLGGYSYNWLILSVVWYYIFKKFMYIINDLLLKY